MFERYLTDAVASYFGHLVHNLDKDQIRLSAWNGELALEDVLLRRRALDHYVTKSPVEIAYGRVGKLKIRIPWKLLQSTLRKELVGPPGEVILSDVEILLIPRRHHHEDEETEDEETSALQKELEAQAQLDAQLLKRVAKSTVQQSSNRWQWLVDRLVSVLANLKITVQNVHIRYEDPGYCMGFHWDETNLHNRYRPPMAVGIQLQQFSVQSGDETSDIATTRLLIAENLACYWDSDARMLFTSETPDMKKLRGHSYVLSPFSPRILLTRGATSELNVQVPACHLALSRSVLEDLGYLRQSMASWRRDQSGLFSPATLRKLASLRPVRFQARAWWKYVLTAVRALHEGPPTGWRGFYRAFVRRKQYVELYRELLSNLDDRERLHDELCTMEAELTATEVAAFRLSAYDIRSEMIPATPVTPKENMSRDPTTLESRLSMYAEMVQALDREKDNEADDEEVRENGVRDGLLWKSSVVFNDFSLQVNDLKSLYGQRDRELPVVRLCCSMSLDHSLYATTSWVVTWSVSDVLIRDLIAARKAYPYLLRPKSSDSVEVITVSVERARSPFGESFVSTTTTHVRIVPVEVVYSTAPVEALSRILGYANVNLVDDYHRIASAMHRWRDRQKRRLFAALAHREKVIVLDVDIGAPVILVPETENGPVLRVGLGRMAFSNAKVEMKDMSESTDDRWHLELSDIEVQCTSGGTGGTVQQIIEPFSLLFLARSRFKQNEDDDTTGEMEINIDASIPKLAFNVTSSAVRLIGRLKDQWSLRRSQMPRASVAFPRDVLGAGHNGGQQSDALLLPDTATIGDDGSERIVVFTFSAPLLTFMLENDVDGRDSTAVGSTKLLDVRFDRVGGHVRSVKYRSGRSELHCGARLHSLVMVDRYQLAGLEFSKLVSSLPPGEEADSVGDETEVIELVTLDYSAARSPRAVHLGADRLAVRFHELYVQWNPETIAAIGRAMAVPTSETKDDPTLESESFFDAQEEEFFDVQSETSSVGSRALSEILSSRQSSQSDFPCESPPRVPWSGLLQTTVAGVASPGQLVHSSWLPRHCSPSSSPKKQSRQSLECTFRLSRLSMEFNKDYRRRRVFSAAMTDSFFSFQTNPYGGSRTNASIGNLIVLDTGTSASRTLYKKILGLQTGDTDGSLLRFSLSINPRERQMSFVPDDTMVGSEDVSVSIDYDAGLVRGCDFSVNATLSPMRFVYIQQLWLEIVDYFFEGIIGSGVWSGRPSSTLPSLDVPDSPSVVESFTFTRFEIQVESPTIILPVSYCSVDSLVVQASRIFVGNRYRLRLRDEQSFHHQWYNDCNVEIRDISVSTTSGSALTKQGKSMSATLSIDWPSGPTAFLVTPKWRVRSNVDQFELLLLREDFALLQSFMSCNLGESSRHMHEWDVLMSLPRETLDRLLHEVLVHFGYDKKDVTPTTYSVVVDVPVISFQLGESGSVARIDCRRVRWSYMKDRDLVSCQHVSCDVSVRGGRSDDVARQTLLLSPRNGHDADLKGSSGSLLYSSTTRPCGSNEKTLALSSMTMSLIYQPWLSLATFFSSLPRPTFASPQDVIEVGERWYPIGQRTPIPQDDMPAPIEWIALSERREDSPDGATLTTDPPKFVFVFKLVQPLVRLGDDPVSSVRLTADALSFRHVGKSGLVSRMITMECMILSTLVAKSTYHDLSDPFNGSISLSRCNGMRTCTCAKHSFSAHASSLTVHVSFNDMLVLTRAGSSFAEDMKTARPKAEGGSARGQDSRGEEDGSAPCSTNEYSFAGSDMRIVIVDDTGRHFSGVQELASLSVEGIYASRRLSTSGGVCTETSMLEVCRLHVTDCLQSDDSPFRQVLDVLSEAADSASGSSPIEKRVASRFSEMRLPGNENDSRGVGLRIQRTKTRRREAVQVVVRSVDCQYNPSMVIALQRFLGRLRKELRGMTAVGVQPSARATLPRNNHVEPLLEVKASLARLSVKLNKEHQGRSLVMMGVLDGHVDYSFDKGALSVHGYCSDLFALDVDRYDCAHDSNRWLCRTASQGSKLLQVRFQKFSPMSEGTDSPFMVPAWVKEVDDGLGIDDTLEVSVGALELSFISTRTKELLDYLSNGLPGKGMGVTKDAAKGFVSKRIEKRSFLMITVQSMVAVVPQSIEHDRRLVLSCRIDSKSWIESRNRARQLILQLSGGNCHIESVDAADGFSGTDIVSDLRFDVAFEKEATRMSLSVRPSNLDVVLAYSDFCHLNGILKANLNAPVDRSLWENLEAQWEGSQDYSRDVEYSENARHVRYGQRKVRSTEASQEFRFRLLLASCAATLRRDDGGRSGFSPYDVVLFEARKVDLSYDSVADGEHIVLSLGTISLSDAGDEGRLRRGQARGDPNLMVACAFTSLIEGYSGQQLTGEAGNPRLLVSLDRRKDAHSGLQVNVVVNYLSFTMLPRPVEEVLAFFTMSWTTGEDDIEHRRSSESMSMTGHVEESIPGDPSTNERHDGVSNTEVGSAVKSEDATRHVKVVLHYPRFIFLVDESDRRTRALVLRGLAIVNTQQEGVAGSRQVFRVNADLQNIASSIVPDVSEYTTSESNESMAGIEGPCGPDNDVHGVPLLLPLTIGVDFEQTSSHDSPRQRVVAVSIEPLSVMISPEDLRLLVVVARRLRSTSRTKKGRTAVRMIDVSFNTTRLGLGLRKETMGIVVDATEHESIAVGDLLYAINGDEIDALGDPMLPDVVERLRTLPRPLRLTFKRVDKSEHDIDRQLESVDGVSSKDSIDVALSSATLTVLHNDIPIARGLLNSSNLKFSQERGSSLRRHLSTTTGVSIDAYNLGLWTWEPLLEPAQLSSTIAFAKPTSGPRELTMEVSDKQNGPLSFNVSSPGISSLMRLKKCKDTILEILETSEAAGNDAREAANVALQFARRQRQDETKPFIFSNNVGVSCALLLQNAISVHDTTSRRIASLEDYGGADAWDAEQVHIVAPGESTKFRIDRAKAEMRPGRSAVPTSTVAIAFQEVSGSLFNPLSDLQISRPDERLLTLSLEHSSQPIDHPLVSVAWSVSYDDEKTLLSLGGSVRVHSFLSSPVEIAVDLPGEGIRSLRTLCRREILHIPLWVLVRKDYKVMVRPMGGFAFTEALSSTTLFATAPGRQEARAISCTPIGSRRESVQISSLLLRFDEYQCLTLDASLEIRNFLPVSIGWEIARGDGQSYEAVDGSECRSETLASGSGVDILIAFREDLFIRLNIGGWTSWAAIRDLSLGSVVSSEDEFGVLRNVSLRSNPKAIGLQVIIFTEMWLLNSSNEDVAFGVPKRQIYGIQVSADEKPDDLSAAEAALKEFSSIFDSHESKTSILDRLTARPTDGDILTIPSQQNCTISEEVYEYLEVSHSLVRHRWWATSDPASLRPNLTLIAKDGVDWKWVDTEWRVDSRVSTLDGWESSADCEFFAPGTQSSLESHRFRRRRWYRRHRGVLDNMVSAYHHSGVINTGNVSKQDPAKDLRVAFRVGDGAWSISSGIPRHGQAYGAVKLASAPLESSSFEYCYHVYPLEGEMGDFTRMLVISPRFLLRNDSKTLSFDVKQYGSPDSAAITLLPGTTRPFQWADAKMPELLSVRPAFETGAGSFKWSGGFDPLSIGSIPLRMRQLRGDGDDQRPGVGDVKSVLLESSIRSKTGGTGIVLSFVEEDPSGDSCRYRIENHSPFPIWFSQDGLLANSSRSSVDDHLYDGDIVRPSQRVPFALDIPYRQGKYSHREAAKLEELLRVRLGLAPLSSRSGIETTKAIALSSFGITVRLNPSKLTILPGPLREKLQRVRVLGLVTNDGPTRCLRFSLIQKTENLFSISFSDNSLAGETDGGSNISLYTSEVVHGAKEACESATATDLPDEESAVALLLTESNEAAFRLTSDEPEHNDTKQTISDDMVMSVRVAISGALFSFIDTTPTEIAVATFKNLNGLVTWTRLRSADSTSFLTVNEFQVDNMLPNASFPVAVCRDDNVTSSTEGPAPMLVIGVAFAPRHKSGIQVLKSVTVAPRNLSIRVDLAFLVRLQKFYLDLREQLNSKVMLHDESPLPDLSLKLNELQAAARAGVGRQKFYFGGLTILPCSIRLSVAPARALTAAQATLEGEEAAAIHRAVRKGDIKMEKGAAMLGVKIGHRNSTPLAVVRGVFKSIVVDALLRLDGASISFAGVSLINHISTASQLGSHLGAHYMSSLRQNVPALLGSLAAFGNPIGLVRGLGDGVSDLILEPVKGFQKSIQEMDPTYLVDGVARGTVSLARHTVGGFADSAAALTETFSKNMTVLTLDRRYAQRRDIGENLRLQGDINVALGLGSGVQKLMLGFVEGVSGVVRAPMRGAEKRGFEGFAKGLGKGLLGLLVKPIIGISDGITDVMIGVKGSIEGPGGQSMLIAQVRPRRPMYGPDRLLRPYNLADAAAAALMMRTRLAGETYSSHLDMGDRLALLSTSRVLLIGSTGEEKLVLKYKHIESMEVQRMDREDGSSSWGLVIVLNRPRKNGSDVEVVECGEQAKAQDLKNLIEKGIELALQDPHAVD